MDPSIQAGLMPAKDVAALFDKTEASLAQWRYEHRGPKYVRVGRKIFYRRQDVQAYIDANVHETTNS